MSVNSCGSGGLWLRPPDSAAFISWASTTASSRGTRDRPADKRVVILKSWNEWAEGHNEEPDQRYGRGFLEAIRDQVA